MAYSHPDELQEPDDAEAMMKLDIPLPAAHQLDQLSGQCALWRQSRSHPHERLPEPLWDQAVALPSTLAPSRVAKHLRLRGNDLKKQSPTRQDTAAPRPAPAGFVAVPKPSAQPPVLGAMEVELSRPDSARLRLHAPDASRPLAAIVQSFLEAR